MSEQSIHLLDEITINQIAAGEVIENPASVVKELVENALDSGARSITVETKGGGRGLVRVSDDGCGMGGDDLVLSLERHATSKLSQLEDLNVLGTLGFRGEALPSIASVSKLSIHTSMNGEQGEQLISEGGRILKVISAPRKRGTTVEVKTLFYNVPARKKFQKSMGSDSAEIHKVLTKMALCHPHVAFFWIADGQTHLSSPAEEGLKERVAALLGEEFASSMLPVEHLQTPLALKGFCSAPSHHRPNRTGQHLFLNGRAVFSPFISRKVLEAYGTRLSTHRYPLFVLHFTLPPGWIDVNVHPQKWEVRLREEGKVAPFILAAIERAFAPKERPPTVAMPRDFVAAEPRAPFDMPSLYDVVESEESLPLFTMKRKVLSKVGKYLFVEDPEGVRVVDASAARLRVIFERLTETEGQKEVQQLLIPVQIEVAGAEKTLLLAHLDYFEKSGFSVRHFGENTFIIDAIPACFSTEETEAYFHAFLEQGDLPPEKRVARALNRTLPLSTEGGAALVEQLFACRDPDFTPEGKKIHHLLSEKELARSFS